jgi:hypothetical protein
MQSVYNAASNFKLHEKLFNWLIRTYRNDRNHKHKVSLFTHKQQEKKK